MAKVVLGDPEIVLNIPRKLRVVSEFSIDYEDTQQIIRDVMVERFDGEDAMGCVRWRGITQTDSEKALIWTIKELAQALATALGVPKPEDVTDFTKKDFKEDELNG
jgi:hypothetical protein